DVDPGTSKFDLYLELADHGPHMVGRCVYQTDLFDAPTIGRFVQHYRRTLEAFVADPEQRLSALPLVDEVERARLLEWGTRRGSYPEMPIHRIFEAHVARRPDAVALVADDRRRSEEHTSELQSRGHLVCRLLLEKKKTRMNYR